MCCLWVIFNSEELWSDKIEIWCCMDEECSTEENNVVGSIKLIKYEYPQHEYTFHNCKMVISKLNDYFFITTSTFAAFTIVFAWWSTEPKGHQMATLSHFSLPLDGFTSYTVSFTFHKLPLDGTMKRLNIVICRPLGYFCCSSWYIPGLSSP